MRKMLVLFLMALVVFGLVSCGEKEKKEEPGPKIMAAKIETGLGDIVFRFFDNKAPGHVANFIKLTQEGFYDGSSFHWVVPGFKIEGGTASGDENDTRPGYGLKPEISDLKHTRGKVSMERSIGQDNSGSRFFILLKDAPDLNGSYTIFGEVVLGMEIVYSISEVTVDSLGRPFEKVSINKVSIVEIPDPGTAK
jgi:peptidyl-prolyl cis-trans isomerase B (cyclophilin B)